MQLILTQQTLTQWTTAIAEGNISVQSDGDAFLQADIDQNEDDSDAGDIILQIDALCCSAL